MEKEFSLSDYQEKDATGFVYPEEKLKQFIKLLKEELNRILCDDDFKNACEEIDKIFGDKLIERSKE